MCFGQLRIFGKSNEITTIQMLLELLDLKVVHLKINTMDFQSGIVIKLLEEMLSVFSLYRVRKIFRLKIKPKIKQDATMTVK